MKENGQMDLFGGLDTYGAYQSDPLTELQLKEIEKRQNEVADKIKENLDKKIKGELEKAQEVTERMDSLEIMPLGNYVLVKPYSENPYEKIEITDSGLIIPVYKGQFKNPDSGEDDHEQNLSCQATVIEVGPLVKWVKEGDDIYYRRVSGVPIPFFRQGFEVVAETSIQCVINEGVKARWARIKGEE